MSYWSSMLEDVDHVRRLSRSPACLRPEHPETIGQIIARGTATPSPRRIVALKDNGPIRRGTVFTFHSDSAGGAWWTADGMHCVPALILAEFWGSYYGPAPAQQGELFAA